MCLSRFENSNAKESPAEDCSKDADYSLFLILLTLDILSPRPSHSACAMMPPKPRMEMIGRSSLNWS